MVHSKALKINQLIHIEIEDQEGRLERLPSRIEGINGKHLSIAMPIRHGVLVPLRLGQEATIIISDKSGMLSAVTRVLGRQREPIPVVIMELPDEFDNLAQRREFVRLEISMPISFNLWFENEEDSPAFKSGTIVDLSAGGVLFVSRMKMEVGRLLKLCIILGDDELRCKAQILRCDKVEGAGNSYGIAVKFVDISEALRDQIVGFVFAKQREWIKKGLI